MKVCPECPDNGFTEKTQVVDEEKAEEVHDLKAEEVTDLKAEEKSEKTLSHQHQPHSHNHLFTVSKASGVLLVVAIGSHALFEGLAFGIQKSFYDTWKLAMGIVIHKTVAALSLGGTFANAGYNWKQAVGLLVVFSLLAPAGVVIGMFLTEVNPLVDVIFMSLSAGTFLYVSCTEIIKNEFERRQRQWLQFLMVMLGGAVICMLWFFEAEHEHDAGHDLHDDELHADD